MSEQQKPNDLDPLRTRFTYTAFGLSVESCVELPELTPAAAGGDVVIRRSESSRYSDAMANGAAILQDTGDGLLYTLEAVGSFCVRGGREIEVDPAPDVESRVLRLSLLGPAMSLILCQRGHLLVHASALVVGDQAALFVSAHNGGKSTMATAMAGRGHRLLSDDLTCVVLSASPPVVVPGIAQVKLCPDAVAALVPADAQLHPLHPASTKVGLRSSQLMSSEAVPVTRVYFLEDADDLEVSPVEADKALARLIAHWYGARFGTALLEFLDKGALFLGFVEFAKSSSFRSLARPRSLDLLPRVAAAVEEDMANASPPAAQSRRSAG